MRVGGLVTHLDGDFDMGGGCVILVTIVVARSMQVLETDFASFL